MYFESALDSSGTLQFSGGNCFARSNASMERYYNEKVYPSAVRPSAFGPSNHGWNICVGKGGPEDETERRFSKAPLADSRRGLLRPPVAFSTADRHLRLLNESVRAYFRRQELPLSSSAPRTNERRSDLAKRKLLSRRWPEHGKTCSSGFYPRIGEKRLKVVAKVKR